MVPYQGLISFSLLVFSLRVHTENPKRQFGFSAESWVSLARSELLWLCPINTQAGKQHDLSASSVHPEP